MWWVNGRCLQDGVEFRDKTANSSDISEQLDASQRCLNQATWTTVAVVTAQLSDAIAELFEASWQGHFGDAGLKAFSVGESINNWARFAVPLVTYAATARVGAALDNVAEVWSASKERPYPRVTQECALLYLASPCCVSEIPGAAINASRRALRETRR